jgi:pentalenolactone F synthase
MTAEVRGSIRAALHAHRVLVFRGQSRPNAALVEFAQCFGRLVTLYEHDTTEPGQPGIVRVSNVEKDGRPIGLAGDQEIPWHHDHSYLACPAKESFLEAVELPADAPATSFLDMAAALESFPKALREKIAELRSVHHIDERSDTSDASCASDGSDPSETPGSSKADSARHDVSGATPDYSDATNTLAQERIAAQRATHPLVARHPESGIAALYASPLATHQIEDLSCKDSRALLDELFARALRPAFTYSHAWSPGDFVVWDSITTLHRRDAFNPAGRRLMKQMSTQCEQPLEAALP